MNLAQAAFQRLFPERPVDNSFRLRYSGRFASFNGNIQKKGNVITVNLSKQWIKVSHDIQIGIIHELLVKLYKVKKHTIEMDLYANFMRSVHTEIPKTDQHPVLASSFNRVNKEYFNGMMDMPNLILSSGARTLGFYDYGRDQISISRHLLKDEELLDYIMYHEMLHKHFKFSYRNGRNLHHSRAFREAEKRFRNAEDCEKRLSRITRWHLW